MSPACLHNEIIERDRFAMIINNLLSPYPCGVYTIPFGRNSREIEKVNGIKIFLMHGFVQNGTKVTDGTNWVTKDHFVALKKKTKSDSEKKALSNIIDCL